MTKRIRKELPDEEILDWRSSGRRRARRALYAAEVPYECVGYRLADGTRSNCKKTSKLPPKDAPDHFEEIWPKGNRVLDYPLEADHETKDWTNNEVEAINWKCKSCHRLDDNATAKGVAQVTKNYW